MSEKPIEVRLVGAVADLKCAADQVTMAGQEIDDLRATIEARDAEIADLKHDTDELIRKWRMVNARADAAEERVKELEDLLKRSNKASKMEDLARIAELESLCEEQKDALLNPEDAVNAQGELLREQAGRIATLERELAEANRSRFFWKTRFKESTIYGDKRKLNDLLDAEKDRNDRLKVELAESKKELRDTTWQDHADHWQKRAVKGAKEASAIRRTIQRALENCTTYDQLEAALYDLIDDAREE